MVTLATPLASVSAVPTDGENIVSGGLGRKGHAGVDETEGDGRRR